ncbi:MAG: hypothetical protein VKK04_23680 [Synechococcales bacterium]|nr:hypothetical protein [Synechococcales bacterium]
MKFNLFDTVKLRERITLDDSHFFPEATIGTIVEILNDGEAYLVELFGDWVKYDQDENLVTATRDDPDAFLESVGVETIYPHQLRLVKPARETVGIRAQLLSVLEGMPESMLAEVTNFAEFLQQKSTSGFC